MTAVVWLQCWSAAPNVQKWSGNPVHGLSSFRCIVHALQVYVLLFGVGQKDTEGIYSLRAVSDDGLPTETIIAFENMEDAIR